MVASVLKHVSHDNMKIQCDASEKFQTFYYEVFEAVEADSEFKVEMAVENFVI